MGTANWKQRPILQPVRLCAQNGFDRTGLMRIDMRLFAPGTKPADIHLELVGDKYTRG